MNILQRTSTATVSARDAPCSCCAAATSAAAGIVMKQERSAAGCAAPEQSFLPPAPLPARSRVGHPAHAGGHDVSKLGERPEQARGENGECAALCVAWSRGTPVEPPTLPHLRCFQADGPLPLWPLPRHGPDPPTRRSPLPSLAQWGSLRYANNAAFLALLRAAQLPAGAVRASAVSFAKLQVDYRCVQFALLSCSTLQQPAILQPCRAPAPPRRCLQPGPQRPLLCHRL